MILPGFPRIIVDSSICGGRPTIKGTRMRVSDILDILADGSNADEILEDFPYISAEDINAALNYAAVMANHPIVIAAE